MQEQVPEHFLEFKKKIDKAKADFVAADERLCTLRNICPHTYIKKYNSAVCVLCGKNGGWWCPGSNNHLCWYINDGGKVNMDSCIYCGDPEERK